MPTQEELLAQLKAKLNQSQQPKPKAPELACPLLGLISGMSMSTSVHVCVKEKCKFWGVEFESPECKILLCLDAIFEIADMLGQMSQLTKLINSLPPEMQQQIQQLGQIVQDSPDKNIGKENNNEDVNEDVSEDDEETIKD